MKPLILSVVFLLVGLTLLTGCAVNKSPVVDLTPPPCEDALAAATESVTDAELAVVLEDAVFKNEMDACWKPLMMKSLRENRKIPLEHLELGIKAFNEKQYINIYHMVIVQYFGSVINGEKTYEAKDKLLLETYTRFVIQSADAANDKKLLDAKYLCKRLDTDLFNKFFN